jgi:hypothetical protein
MSTPSNHTSITSFFNECEPGPEESQISLDSSIEDSNMVEYSAHSRYSALSSGLGRPRAASGGQSLLGPLEEGQEGSEIHTPSLSKNSSDAENNNALSNIKADNLSSNNRSTSSNRRINFSAIMGGGILKPSRFTAGSVVPPVPPPPPGYPSFSKGEIRQSISKAKVQQQQQQQQRDEIPVLSVTTVLANAKSEETDSAFLTSLGITNASNTPTTTTFDTTVPNTPLASEPSQRTSATFGIIPGNVPSETLHTSNLRANADGGFPSRDADRVAAWAIHIALIFFCGLVVASVLISFTVIRKYGFVTLLGLLTMLVFVGFLAVFVDQTILSKNPKLRPIRQKIAAAIEATKGLLVEEYHLLMQDWNEHLLLTQGQEQYQAYTDGGNSSYNNNNNNTRLPSPSVPHGRKRSKLFKIVRPLLGLKTKLFGNKRRNRQQPSAGSASSTGTMATNNHTSVGQTLQGRTQDYQPPDKLTTGVLS